MIILNDKLKMLREKNGLSRSQVAEMLGVTTAFVSACELGTRRPSLENLLAFAQLYHVTTDYLLGRDSSENVLDLNGLSAKQLEAVSLIVHDLRSINAKE